MAVMTSLVMKWLYLVQVTSHTVVCSDHFTLDCFKRRMVGARRDLKPDAVPTLFVWTKTHKSRRRLVRRVSSAAAAGDNSSMETETTVTATEPCVERFVDI